MQEAVTKMFAASFNTSNSRCDCSTRTVANYTNSQSFPTISSTATSDRILQLTPVKWTLLLEHEGCFKCRQPYAGHIGPKCLNGFPSKADYKPITEVDMLLVKKKHEKKKVTKAAAVLPAVNIAPVLAAVVMPSAVLSNGSDSECVIAPFSTPHFFLDCCVGGSSCSIQSETNALIDHGCDSVLISPALADNIGLVHHKLPKPKEVIMAVGKKNKTFIFEEWGKLTVVSADQLWTSRICRAIIAPNLSLPLILGGPFLTSNQLVIDHET